MRALTGSIVLDELGLDHKIVLGGLMYRAGPAPWDLVMFAGEDNCGHHPGLYHSWIESGEDLIDFSCGDWADITASSELNPSKLPPINFTYPPPEFIWRKRQPLVDAWRPTPYGPWPGRAWYCPIAEQNRANFDLGLAEARPIVQEAAEKLMIGAGIPVFKTFTSDIEREEYMRQHKGTFVLID